MALRPDHHGRLARLFGRDDWSVLVVDDDASHARLAARTLQRLGGPGRVRFVADVRHLPEELDVNGRPDVAVLDDVTFGGGHREAALALRARWPDVPVVLHTGSASYGVVRSSSGAAFPNLRRPFPMEALFHAVERAVAIAVGSRSDLLAEVLEALGPIPDQLTEADAPIRIAIADDHAAERLSEQLQVLGPLPVRASTGGELLGDLLTEPAPRLVLVDQDLPDVTGEEVVVRILARWPTLPVVLTRVEGLLPVVRGPSGRPVANAGLPTTTDRLLQAVLVAAGR